MSDEIIELTVAGLLAAGLDLPAIDIAPETLSDGAHGIIGGRPIAVGYSALKLASAATSEFLDTYGGNPTGPLSESEARAIKAANPRAGNLPGKSTIVFADGACWQPLIAVESARASNRPTWSALARQVWPERAGQPLFMLVTTDTKRRLWPNGRVGILGGRTPVLIHAPGIGVSGTRVVDWPRLLALLDVIEEVWRLGFAKPVIRQSLFRQADKVAEVGVHRVRALETALADARENHRAEFDLAWLIAQKESE